jgi:hypothetical protein
MRFSGFAVGAMASVLMAGTVCAQTAGARAAAGTALAPAPAAPSASDRDFRALCGAPLAPTAAILAAADGAGWVSGPPNDHRPASLGFMTVTDYEMRARSAAPDASQLMVGTGEVTLGPGKTAPARVCSVLVVGDGAPAAFTGEKAALAGPAIAQKASPDDPNGGMAIHLIDAATGANIAQDPGPDAFSAGKVAMVFMAGAKGRATILAYVAAAPAAAPKP